MAKRARRYVVLLRGVNVGGRGKLAMAQLRETCTSLGCTDVSTYIQSGNVVLDSARSADELAAALGPAIEEAVGFAPQVVIRTPAELAAVLAGNPYPDTDTDERFLHIGFMTKTPDTSAVAELGEVDVSPEGYRIVGREVYLNYVEGAGRSKKLARVPFERRLGVGITARNLRTVQKLVELAS
jgi:uncharacterized protein (DUF1697 family)